MLGGQEYTQGSAHKLMLNGPGLHSLRLLVTHVAGCPAGEVVQCCSAAALELDKAGVGQPSAWVAAIAKKPTFTSERQLLWQNHALGYGRVSPVLTSVLPGQQAFAPPLGCTAAAAAQLMPLLPSLEQPSRCQGTPLPQPNYCSMMPWSYWSQCYSVHQGACHASHCPIMPIPCCGCTRPGR